MVKKVFDEKYRQLFIHSSFLRDNPSTSSIYKTITQDNFYDIFYDLPVDTQNQLKLNYELWIAMCQKEWHASKEKRETNITNKKYKPKCELCNTQLKTKVFHIVNEKNGEQLNIGSECFKHMLNQEGQMFLHYTEAEAKKAMNVRNKFPELFHFLNEKLYDHSKYILPLSIIKQEILLKRSIKSKITSYNKGKKQIDVFNTLNAQLINLKMKIERADSRENYQVLLTRKQVNWLKIHQSDKVSAITSEVAKNNGRINTSAACLILEPTFLKEYCSSFNTKLEESGSNISIFVNQNKLSFNYPIENNIYILTCTVKNTINYSGFPDLKIDLPSLSKFIANNLQNISPASNLIQLSLKCLNQAGFKLYQISAKQLQKYINKQEQDFKTNRTIVNKNKLQKILQQKFIFIDKNHNFYIFTVDQLKSIGKKHVQTTLLTSNFVINKSKFITITKDNLFKKIYDDYVLSSINQ